MKEMIEKDIDGEQYSFYQLGAIKSHNLLLKIGKIVGPALGALQDVEEEESILDAKIDLTAILEGIFDKADEKTLEGIIVTLCSQITHNGENGTGPLKSIEIIDLHFKGRLPSMYKVLYTALEAQYSDFLGGGGILGKLKAKSKKRKS